MDWGFLGEMKSFQWPFWIIGLSFQYLVTQALLSGAFRQFTVIFAYLLCLTLTTITDILIRLDVGKVGSIYISYYWAGDLLRESALYAVVISLILHAMPNSRRRAALLRVLVALAMLFWAGSIVVCQDPNFTKWMTKVVRNLSFCSAVSTLILWFVLIASEKRDTRLLVITGGLGLQMTGEAIGQSLIQISKSTQEVGWLTMLFAHFLCLYIWWRAFSTSPENAPAT